MSYPNIIEKYVQLLTKFISKQFFQVWMRLWAYFHCKLLYYL